jgi:hypothetical protein
MKYTADEFKYGPVVVSQGKHKGRIGELDDDTMHRKKLHGVVKFSPFGIARQHYLIPIEYLTLPNTPQLLHRYHQLFAQLTPYLRAALEGEERIAALEEIAYVSDLLSNRMFSARFSHAPRGAKIFLSHSSADKPFVTGLAVDLSALGHQPWFDDWDILAGESIPEKISSGIEEADFVVVVLSRHAVESKWVANEWQAKYWNEIIERRVAVIPVLLDECNIPTLLRTKKYIDFRVGYPDALDQLVDAIGRHMKSSQE